MTKICYIIHNQNLFHGPLFKSGAIFIMAKPRFLIAQLNRCKVRRVKNRHFGALDLFIHSGGFAYSDAN